MSAADLLTQAVDSCAGLMEQAAAALDRGERPEDVAAFLRLAAHGARVAIRPPMTEADVRHAAARLRLDDPRAVFPELGRDLAGGAG